MKKNRSKVNFLEQFKGKCELMPSSGLSSIVNDPNARGIDKYEIIKAFKKTLQDDIDLIDRETKQTQLSMNSPLLNLRSENDFREFLAHYYNLQMNPIPKSASDLEAYKKHNDQQALEAHQNSLYLQKKQQESKRLNNRISESSITTKQHHLIKALKSSSLTMIQYNDK